MIGHRYNAPFPAKEKLRILNLLRSYTIAFLARRYHLTIQSIYRWKRIYDGTPESLDNKSHRPLAPHPNRHTDSEVKNIITLRRRNPDIGINELYWKLCQNYGYDRHPASLYKWLRKNGFYDSRQRPKKKYIPKPYDTPARLGEKWQLDVKVVPRECYAKNTFFDCKYYQYTMLEEASRERFIYIYPEQSGYSSRDFLIRSIKFFGYKPLAVQTDNGQEFTYLIQTDRVHTFDILCNRLNIEHKLIRPRTPRHNGKVERSHRTDNERFYSKITFYSYGDLQKQAAAWLKRYNEASMSVLYPTGGRKRDWLSPVQKRDELMSIDLGPRFVLKYN